MRRSENRVRFLYLHSHAELEEEEERIMSRQERRVNMMYNSLNIDA
jgi:hypothetical protein